MAPQDSSAPASSRQDSQGASVRAALQQQFLERLFGFCYSYPQDNYDALRFGTEGVSLAGRAKKWLKVVLGRRKFASPHFDPGGASTRLLEVLAALGQHHRFTTDLLDERSRDLLLDVLCMRVLGPRHVRLPLNTSEYWTLYSSIGKYERQRQTGKTDFWELNLYELPGVRGTIMLQAPAIGILNTFLVQQYAYRKGPRDIAAEPGDIVIDAGGCYGDTALYFADRVGPTGKVYTFEFVPDNVDILRSNLERNSATSECVKLVERAVWSHSNEAVPFAARGPASSVGSQNQSAQEASSVMTLAIDDLVRDEQLARVDFIKMDIEGAELRALRGAEHTLRRFKPKLAISIYHKVDDFGVIPEFLDELGLGYRFAIDHYTLHGEETVLFASVE